MIFELEDLLKLLVAVVVGGLIGAEREFRDMAAGFRTLIFICAGSTVFTIISERLGGPTDRARIAARSSPAWDSWGPASFCDGGRVLGLTTAATIWLTAALGMSIGAGQYLFTALATAVALVVLWCFRKSRRGSTT
jgi:putative Mg2+ transporter-C (MgtC) family protein